MKRRILLGAACCAAALVGLSGVVYVPPSAATEVASALGTRDMGLLVGTACCNNVSTLAENYCSKTQLQCPDKGPNQCNISAWSGACAVENGQKSSGTGTATIHEVQCTGTYRHGMCVHNGIFCTQGAPDADSPSTCGTKWTAGAC